MIEIDGSYGEGGGQILRTCCTLAAVTGQGFRVTNIRAGREKSGLRAQHLAAVGAAAEICGAQLRGAEVGSTELAFQPMHAVRPGAYQFKIETAGSATLVLQTVFAALALRGGGSLSITGGTHNPLAPTADYLIRCFVPLAERMGWPLHIEYGPAGFYPAGGGELRATIGPATPKRLIEYGDSEEEVVARGVILTAGLPDKVGERAAQAFSYHFGGKCQVRDVEAASPGFVAMAFLGDRLVSGFTEFGEKSKSAEAVVADLFESATGAFENGFGGLDAHLADQVVILAALCPEESLWQANSVSEHLRTVLWVVREFGCPVAEWDEGSGLVRVVGFDLGSTRGAES